MKRFKAFAESVTGRSHTLTGKICQDSVGISENDRMSLAVVADGHGGKMYIRSDKGSAFAVEAAVSCIGRFVSSIAPDDDVCDGRMIPLSELMSPVHGEELIRNLEKSILVEWHRLVNQHHSAFPFSEEELEGLKPKEQRRLMGSDFCHAYGSTLIAAAVTEQFCLIIQIGDGYAVTVSGDGSASVALELDPLCHDNVCTSICQENAPEHFCHVLLTDIPAAVFAASDGVDDSYPGRSALLHFYNGLTSGFASGTDEGIDTVRRFLPRITDMGKGDDTSIVGIIDNSRIADAALKAGELFDTDAAREKDTMPDGSIMPPEGGGAETEQAPECAEKDLPEKTGVTSVEDEARDSGEDEARDSGEDEARDSVEDEARDSGEDEARDSVEDEARDSVEDEARDSGEDEAHNSGEDAPDNSGDTADRRSDFYNDYFTKGSDFLC